jgi:hypothetical protein
MVRLRPAEVRPADIGSDGMRHVAPGQLAIVALPQPDPDDELVEVEELDELEMLDGSLGTPALRLLRSRHRRSPETEALYARALLLWPGLSRRALSRCDGDPVKVARLVMRRTVLDEAGIVELLTRER